MSEYLHARGEFFELNAQLDGRAASALLFAQAFRGHTITEHVRRAVAVYDFILSKEVADSRIYVHSDEEEETVSAYRDSLDLALGPPLCVKVNAETANALLNMETFEGQDVQVIVNRAAIQYGQILGNVSLGRQYFFESDSGQIEEIILLD